MSVISRKVAGIQYPNSIVDEEWEYLDPTPGEHKCFFYASLTLAFIYI